MKKQTARKKKTHSAPSAAGSSRLEQRISRIASSVARFCKTRWRAITGVILALALVAAAVQVVNVMESNARDALHAKLFGLTRSREATDPDGRADTSGLLSLASEARGALSEPIILKEIVQYLFQRVDLAKSDLQQPPVLPGDSTSSEESDRLENREKLKARLEPLLETAEKVVEQGKERFPDSGDMQLWASYAGKRIASERELDKPWQEADQTYRIQPPKEIPSAEPTTGSATAEPAASMTSEGDASEAETTSSSAPNSGSEPSGASAPAETNR